MENVRNFCIISHIDHGKSTLADRFLEITKTVPPNKMKEQFLDSMDLEQERGITIKMQPVRMEYVLEGKQYILNLIDTPGHVDFGYEVSRSLAAVEGVVLLVDATKGIQAQTVANLELARGQNLPVIPAINKIDSPQARIEETEKEIIKLLNIKEEKILRISAKKGINIEDVLKAVVEEIPPPVSEKNGIFRGLIFDSKYDVYKGVIAFLRVFGGKVEKGDKIYLFQEEEKGEAKEVGFFAPHLKETIFLESGDIGYVATGIKESGKVKIGDTVLLEKEKNRNANPLPGYREPKPMVFLSVYPEDSDDFEELKSALERLKLNDASLSFKPEFKEGLGRGFQCGFLGLLHAEIISERLKREFNLNLVLSTPSVVYKIITKEKEEVLVYTAADWVDSPQIEESYELWAKLQVLAPTSYLGSVLDLLKSIESKYIDTKYVGTEKVEVFYEVPLRELITKNFYDRLKKASQGFASMNYEILEWRKVVLARIDFLIAGRKEESLSRVVPEKESFKEGKKMVERLKDVLPHQLFSVPLQAAIDGKIIARENIKAKRKDVIAPLYGGDYTRKRKLLEKQKKGKKGLAQKGKIKISPSTFLEIFKTE